MNVMSYNGFTACAEYSDEDGLFIGHIAGIKDVVGFHGESINELRKAFEEAVTDYLETCARLGRTKESPVDENLRGFFVSNSADFNTPLLLPQIHHLPTIIRIKPLHCLRHLLPIRPKILLKHLALMADHEAHHPGVVILSRPGDQGEAATHLVSNQIAVSAARG